MKTLTLISAVIAVAAITFFNNNCVFAQDKITVCHCPPGKPDKCHSININIDAWAAHLAKHPGDYLGSCTDNPDLKLLRLLVSPNPSSGRTTIEYDLCEESVVKMDVYNEMGYLIETLVNETKQAGVYYKDFSATTSGLYLLNAIAAATDALEAVQISQKIIEIKY